ncbi:bifunctional DNA-formamidopyrimidine glycosylase/DNA-(apurinic or apyrimidinic site) lyase [Amphiplicatus metriothermophilus]|uniref:Formamidopyrimidine-DNA glycosylase n=1 Tax=Amphiplicatus metriothermophilus TaxID=1519374 RepID=A0A239PYQ5_9PROT|nr:bifunctional DNA-formamidopyrimidine glycosylase/DNA-(apurinic or apyrimidinic site) lyase [Amphiplicatus metriothermophilus]MBB5518207.1 formamidopyrimidine-DNA glycosylase [Amphiplicatus metriothermophilus]SNT75384.1 DNA-(apurinic or apyrimidinic site) lyase [Amphiplicatus metriothermophilus]
MPELPEVETVRRGLAPFMVGARIRRVEARRADLRFPLPRDFAARLQGARIEALDRRGKYLVAPLSAGESLVMHLGMSGRFTVDGGDRPDGRYYAAGADPRHDHVVFELDGPAGPARVVYNDPRRFGLMDLVPSGGLDRCRHFAGMGPEPLSDAFVAETFNAALKARAAPIKAALLDQRIVAGIGNIYACEALHRAGVSPRRAARSVAGARGMRLWSALRAVLREAIEAGGSSLRDFAASDGALGYFQHRFRVYDREGAACPVCRAPVRRIVQSGRSTFYCGACQR